MKDSPRRPVGTTKCAAEGDALAPLTALARSFADLVLGEGLSPVQPASRYPAPDAEPLDADQPRTLTDREVRELAGASADQAGENGTNPERR